MEDDDYIGTPEFTQRVVCCSGCGGGFTREFHYTRLDDADDFCYCYRVKEDPMFIGGELYDRGGWSELRPVQDPQKVKDARELLKTASLPLCPKDPPQGFGGTYYTLSFSIHPLQLSFQWWVEPPKPWTVLKIAYEMLSESLGDER